MFARTKPSSPTAAGLALAAVLSVPSLAAAQPERWRLDDPPLIEVGRGDGVLLHDVHDADVLPDGSLLVGDNGSSSVLRVSSAGEVVESLGRPGSGPGEFEMISRVFGVGDTVVAYDSPLSRVTTWIPGVDKPEVRSLPTLNGFPTELMTVLSAHVWLLTSFAHMSNEPNPDAGGLREVWSDIFVFDAATETSRTAGRRLMNYDYFVVEFNRDEAYRTTTYRTEFLGRSHLASVGRRWLFVPLDDAVVEVWGEAESVVAGKVPLPIERRPHRRDAGREVRDRWLSRSRGPAAVRIREMFDNLWDDELPRWAPSVGDMVEVGRDVWLRPFAPPAESEPRWVIVDPIEGVVRATVEVGPDLELLGGSEDAVAVLGQTGLGEQFVQVRRIVRGS